MKLKILMLLSLVAIPVASCTEYKRTDYVYLQTQSYDYFESDRHELFAQIQDSKGKNDGYIDLRFSQIGSIDQEGSLVCNAVENKKIKDTLSYEDMNTCMFLRRKLAAYLETYKNQLSGSDFYNSEVKEYNNIEQPDSNATWQEKSFYEMKEESPVFCFNTGNVTWETTFKPWEIWKNRFNGRDLIISPKKKKQLEERIDQISNMKIVDRNGQDIAELIKKEETLRYQSKN